MGKKVLMTAGGAISSMGFFQWQMHKNYADRVLASGLSPFLCLSDCDPLQLALEFDGLVLTGGDDIEPALYGKAREPQCQISSEFRDKTELALVRAFSKVRKPILGICRGIQIVNVAFGGTLYQHLPKVTQTPHGDGVFHSIEIVKDTPASAMLEGLYEVNSFHHQAVDSLGEGLMVAAKTDGIIEAVYHRDLPILAVQWHPERMEENGQGQKVFNGFALLVGENQGGKEI